jgi:hypothetical protein
MEAEEAEVDVVEGAGAINFLALDDLMVTQEGEPVDPQSIISMDVDHKGNIIFPEIEGSPDHPFLIAVDRSGKKWAILTGTHSAPQLVLDADGFLRSALFRRTPLNPFAFCHRPITVTDTETQLGDVIQQLKTYPRKYGDDIVDHDIILVWTQEVKRVITGADILGRLLRGIVTVPAGHH